MADRAGHAMAAFADRHGPGTLVVAGGVAANAALRAALLAAAARRGFTLVAPPPRLCGDNAVMVAWTGIERLRLGLTDGLDHAPRPRWPLESLAA
jgi:N6-L-threonylcarbamoyladenine synthase